MSSKKREIADWEKEECAKLRAALDGFNAGKSRKDSLTQGKIAEALDMSQGAVSSYLNGYNALNIRVAAEIARMIGVSVESFSPRLAAEIARIAQAAPGAPSAPASPRQGDEEPIGRAIVGRALFEKITPRSRALVDRILEMEAHGALTDEDLKVLTEIVERFGSPK